ncbi:hypothetical protein [Streptomyces cyaneus]|uniref:hypothetical protein n=1 Tax=Streptomyces cyaneus TaxID=1904 RepID=UPI0013E3C2C5|nr:hypothetical protein [Streptomyces cyaneus]
MPTGVEDVGPGGAKGFPVEPCVGVNGPGPADGFIHGDAGGTASRGSDGTPMGGTDVTVC